MISRYRTPLLIVGLISTVSGKRSSIVTTRHSETMTGLGTILALAILAFQPASQATIMYNDGGLHIINTPVAQDVVVDNSTTLQMELGAAVTAPNGGITAASGLDIRGGSVFVGNGGSAQGGSTASPSGGDGMEADSSSVTISVGTFTGGGGGTAGGDGMLADSSSVTISDGTFTGGDGGTVGGDGMLAYSSSVTISDGTFTGGNGGTLEGYSLSSFDSDIVIHGGVFSDDVQLFPDHNSSSTMNIYGGLFAGDARISSNHNSSSTMNIYGGLFAGDVRISADHNSSSTMNLYGGDLSGSIGIFAFSAGANGVLNIYGKGLAYDGSAVTGTLVSGDPLNASLSLFGPGASFNLINVAEPFSVPEPSTFALLGLSVAGGLMRRRKSSIR